MLSSFSSANSTYTIEVLGFGLMEVTREATHGHDLTMVVDQVLCVPAREGGNILEDRVVAFIKDGEVLLRTGYTGSDTYCGLEWGTWEAGRLAHEARQERRLPGHLAPVGVVAR